MCSNICVNACVLSSYVLKGHSPPPYSIEWWIMFLGEVETVIRSGTKSRFGILDFCTSDACGLFFNIVKVVVCLA